MIAADLLDLLRCPLTGQMLSFAGPDVLSEVSARLTSRTGGWPDGLDKPVRPLPEAGLIRADRTTLYPVVDDIPVLLIEQAFLI